MSAHPELLVYADVLEADAQARYPLGAEPHRFRDYDAPRRESVREFYRVHHEHQTLDFVLAKKREYSSPRRCMGVWEAMEFLNQLVDASDPDTDLTQIDHLLQTAEAIRADGHPEWMVLTGLIHDLGKVLCLFGEPQWAVVGDTFPVGCAWDPTIVYHEFLAENPDRRRPETQTDDGIYSPGCGLAAVHMTWGHDEYIHQVLGAYLPTEAQYILRYHSFYPAHQEGAYAHLMDDRDRRMFEWVRRFQPYDLYSKGGARPDLDRLAPIYRAMLDRTFPPEVDW